VVEVVELAVAVVGGLEDIENQKLNQCLVVGQPLL